MELLVILAVFVAGGMLAAKIAERKGRSGGAYLLLSIFLSPLVGILAALAASPDTSKIEASRVATGAERKCPFCAELVKREATICRFCHKDLPPATAPAPQESGAPHFTTREEYDAWIARQVKPRR